MESNDPLEGGSFGVALQREGILTPQRIQQISSGTALDDVEVARGFVRLLISTHNNPPEMLVVRRLIAGADDREQLRVLRGLTDRRFMDIYRAAIQTELRGGVQSGDAVGFGETLGHGLMEHGILQADEADRLLQGVGGKNIAAVYRGLGRLLINAYPILNTKKW